jgi:flagellar biosynthesis protein FlhA
VKDASGKDKDPTQQQQLEGLLKLDEIHLEVGYALVPLVDQSTGGQLLQRIRALRRHLATQLGFLVPSVHITDNIRLKPREYVAELRGVEVARYEIAQDRVLAISSDPHAAPLEGIETREPAFGVAAKWIEPRLQEKALASGYAVVDQTSIIATHLAEIVRQHAHELLTRQETKRLLDALAESHPKLVEELVPRLLSLGELQRILQMLLNEQVSIRDLPAILETLVDNAGVNKNPVHLVETVRQALGRSVVTPHLGTDRKLRVLTLDPAIEEELTRSLEGPIAPERSGVPAVPLLRRLLDGLQALVGDPDSASSTVLLCRSPARFHLRRLLEPFLPRIVVLAPAEIPPGVTVQSLGVIR